MDWYRFFPAYYAEDTLHLTLEQDAIYRRLIDWYMINRVPPLYQATALARICQISIEKWKEHEEIILAFFRIKGGRLHHKRCDIELNRQDDTKKKLSESAKRAHITRKETLEKSNAYLPCQSHASDNVAIDEEREKKKERLLTSTENNKLLPTRASSETFEIDFAEFWSAWSPYKMRKGSRNIASKSYSRARKETDHATLIRTSAQYLANCRNLDCKSKHAATWLNNRGWADEDATGEITKSGDGGHSAGFKNSKPTALDLALADRTHR